VRDFTGRTSLAQTGALLSRCAAIVATNSGGMHIADATDIPIVALFSMHNHPGVWNPVNGKSIVLHHEIACGPCFRSVCPVGNACMASITPEEALEALLAVLPSQREM
jgi:heptosyltransferase-2